MRIRRISVLALGVVMLITTFVATAGASVPAKKHKLPKDACALVTDEQVALLIPGAVAEPIQANPVEVGCHWDNPTALPTFNVTVTKLAGVPVSQLKLSLKAEASEADVPHVKKLGPIAFQDSAIPPNTEVKALIGKLLLSVQFSGDGPVTDDQVAQTLAIAQAVGKKI